MASAKRREGTVLEDEFQGQRSPLKSEPIGVQIVIIESHGNRVTA
ncbi:hypothetical protein TcasGA2_TC000901 [Tribolium castaneum]|uniref:Uncharacterized protein n=1 Tax=Tribolium castaneum TaxID=7070 RepID=D6W920_TRICA|nr:hypothetical protein TcasGA2_TC000901 [Tribolium castaneum]